MAPRKELRIDSAHPDNVDEDFRPCVKRAKINSAESSPVAPKPRSDGAEDPAQCAVDDPVNVKAPVADNKDADTGRKAEVDGATNTDASNKLKAAVDSVTNTDDSTKPKAADDSVTNTDASTKPKAADDSVTNTDASSKANAADEDDTNTEANADAKSGKE